MNWGNKLLVVFVIFGGLISYMVYRCMQTPVNLVNKEYYRDELAYQQVIDGSRKANALSGKVHLRQTGRDILLQLPEEMKHTVIKGSILFYCPSDAGKDRRLSLQVDSGASQAISCCLFLPGQYMVKIQWESEGVQYFTESPFTISSL